MPSARLVAPAVLAAVLAVSGCGKSATTASTQTNASATGTSAKAQPSSKALTPSSGTSRSKAELISVANVICRRVAARRASNRAETNEQIGRVSDELASFEHGVSEELAKLVPPPALAGDWRQIVKGSSSLASYTAKVGRYAHIKQLDSPMAAAVLSHRAALERQLLAIARRDGFVDCAQTI